MSFNVVIPARYGSQRLPGKPLAELEGLPMIVRVARQAEQAGAAEVVVATDDERIVAAVRDAGHLAQMTRVDHPSGSDRVMEVASLRGWDDDAIVINVQGDEPLIPPAVIAQVAAMLTAAPELAAATLCEPILDAAALFDPNVVKVVRDGAGMALYFSRAPIPFARDAFAESRAELPAGGHWWRHIGIYGYRVAALRRFVSLPGSELEALESLEQLRLLENGLSLAVEAACDKVPGGVDTAEDLERVRAELARA